MRSPSSPEKKFTNSALLFKFSYAVLAIRNNNSKPHDQELGNILNYNASDTSHWKRGKKSVKSVYALDALSKKLDVDIEILRDITDGLIDFEEAWFEFSEAENFKTFVADPNESNSSERIERQAILEKMAVEILDRASITSCPVFVPELLTQFPFIELVARGINDKLARATKLKPGQYSIQCRKADMQPHTRIAIVRELAKIILLSEREQFNLPPKKDSLSTFEIQELANLLLVPSLLLRDEFQKIPLRQNAIKMIADVFWVPKSIIRSRITSAILSTLPKNIMSTTDYTNKNHLITNRQAEESFDLSEEEIDLKDSKATNTSSAMN